MSRKAGNLRLLKFFHLLKISQSPKTIYNSIKNVKHVGINLMKHVTGFDKENYKTLLRETKKKTPKNHTHK